MVSETAAPEESQADSPPSRRGRFRRPHPWSDWAAPSAAVALTIVALAPVISVVAQRAGRPYLPMQDSAVMDLRVRDVLTFSANTPLVGAYSHFGWNHPGPTIFYLVAPFAWVFGNAAWATLVGFALLQGIAVIWTARLAWKTGGLAWTAVWMAIMALTYIGTGPAVLQVAWNPSVAVPFFVLYLLQCWVVARGDPRRLLGLLFVASFLVQAHIGYAVLVAVLGGWALVRLAVELRRQRRWPGWLDWIPASAVAIVVWIPAVVLDPVINGSSNLSRIVHFYLHRPKQFPHAGLDAGLGYLATEFRWLPPWLGGAEPVNSVLRQDALPSAVAWLAIPAVLIGLAWWSAWRSRRRGLELVVELVALMVLASAFSLTMIQGERSLYLFYWRVAAGVATVVLLGVTIGADLGAALARRLTARPTTGALRHVGTAVLVAVAAVGFLWVAPAAGNGRGPQSGLEPAASTILAQLRQDGQPDGKAIVRAWGGTTGGLATSVLDQLAREGKPVYVDRTLGYELGYGRAAGPEDVRWVLYVTESSALFNVLSRIPTAKVIARTHPLPPAEDAELTHLQLDLLNQLKAHGAANDVEALGSPYIAVELARVPGLDLSEIQQLAGLNQQVGAHGCLCGIIQFPSDPGLAYQPDYVA